MNHSMLRPNELMLIGGKKKEERMLTDVNGHIFGQLTMPTVEKRMVPTTDGKEMLVWVVYPPKFDATKKYPRAPLLSGGPQQAVSQFWSYRWNLALMAANGYIVIAPNRRGLPGFGTEWNAQISKVTIPAVTWPTILAAVDALRAEPYVDEAHIGATGAKLRRLLSVLSCRQSQQALRRPAGTCRYLQHGAAVSRNRGDVVCQLGYGRSLLGEGQRRRTAHLRQLAPPASSTAGIHPS